MQHADSDFPKMLSVTLIFLAILFFIPNFTMLRLMQLGPLKESLAIFFFPLIYSIADAITEVHGMKRAMFIIFACYFISMFFSIILMLSCYIPYPPGFKNQFAYDLIFHKGPNIILAGFISVSISMLVNIKLMSKLKLKYRNKHFIFRSFISSSIGELIVTGLGYPLIFLKLDYSLLILMINAYLFKVCYSFIGAYPAKIIVFLMKFFDCRKQFNLNDDAPHINEAFKIESINPL